MLETLYVGLSTVILGIEVMKMLKSAIIRKTPDKNEWCLFSRKRNPKTGKRRNFGYYPSLKKVKEREQQVQYFKHAFADIDLNLDTYLPDLPVTQAITCLKRIGTLIGESQDLDNARAVLASASKREMREWLEMTPDDVKHLSNPKLYNILSVIIPDIKTLSKELEDLEYIMGMLKDNKILPLTKKYKNKVLQFKEILVAAIDAPRVDIWAVIKVLEKRHPELRKEIIKIKAKQTKMITRLVKTTVDELESGNPSKFPTKTTPVEVLSSKVDALIKSAGLVDSLQMLVRRLKGNISAIWESVKDKVGETFESLLESIASVIGTFTSMNDELQALL